MPINAPNANRIAQDDVETAILNWDRFTLAPDITNADLVIEVRKSSGRISEGTIGGFPNNRPMGGRGPGGPSMGNDPGSSSLGGNPEDPSIGDNPNNSESPDRAHPQVEAAQAEDVMTVYRGRRGDALDTPTVWRYSAKNALASPDVPAVEAFRKLIAEAEKQQQANHP